MKFKNVYREMSFFCFHENKMVFVDKVNIKCLSLKKCDLNPVFSDKLEVPLSIFFEKLF